MVVVLIVLWCIAESRTGRAWKASREDPLAAEMMGMPVNRLKIMAFSFGAAIAGLAGSVFAAAQTGAFPQNFSTQVLILIYAVVILGGTGSLTGMIVGAIAIIASNQVLDSTSPPNNARVLFYLALIAGVVLTLKPSWKRIAVALGGTVVFGLAVHAIVDAVWSRGTSGQVTSGRLPHRRDPQLRAVADQPGPARRLRLPADDRPGRRAGAAEGLVAGDRATCPRST